MFRTTHLILVVLLLGRTVLSAQPTADISSLHFIGGYEIPHNQSFQKTTIGGLSGIDYDAAGQRYFLICDDRSAINAARFYTARIYTTSKGIDSVRFLEVHTLLQEDGQPFPGSKQNASKAPDPEAIRYNPKTNQLVWTSEGERIVKGSTPVLADPTLSLMDIHGKFVHTFPLPAHLTMTAAEQGPRQNGTLEGLTYSEDYKILYTSMEEPLFEDGPRADLKETYSWIRIYRYDANSKKNTFQYAYRLEPVAYPPILSSAFIVNGVPDILSLGIDKLLVIERSFSTGRLPCTVKVFLADLSRAQDIQKNVSLTKQPPKHPITKKLLLNMDDLGIYIDNIEGVTFGPDLPNGHKTLLFVADNNFNDFEKTQILLFEVIP